MTTWKVLKDDRTGLEDYEPSCWREVGEFESEHSYYLGYPSTVIPEIGRRWGAGEYIFLDDDSRSYATLSIGSRQEFYEVEAEAADVPEGVPEGSTLEAITDPRD